MKQRRVVNTVEAARDGIQLIRLHRIFDASTLDEFNEALKLLIQRQCYHLVVDLEQVEFVSSAGWGALTSELGRLREQGGDLRIAAMAPEIHDVFLLLELDTFMDAYYSVDDAIRSFELDFDRNATDTEDESPAATESTMLEVDSGESAEQIDANSDTPFPPNDTAYSEGQLASDGSLQPDSDLADVQNSASEYRAFVSGQEPEYSAEYVADEYLSQPNVLPDDAEESASNTEIFDSKKIGEYDAGQWDSSTNTESPDNNDIWASEASESDSTQSVFDDNEYWAEVVTGKEISNLWHPAEAGQEPGLTGHVSGRYYDSEDNVEHNPEMISIDNYVADDSQLEEAVYDETSEVTEDGAYHNESEDAASYQPDGMPQHGDPEAVSEDDELAELELHDINDPWLWDEIDSLPEEDESFESEFVSQDIQADQDWEAFDRAFENAERSRIAGYIERPRSQEQNKTVAPAAVIKDHQWLRAEPSYAGKLTRDASQVAARYGAIGFHDDRAVVRDPTDQNAMPVAAGKAMLIQLIKENPHAGPEMLRKTLEEQLDVPLSVSKSTIYRWLKEENLNTKEQRVQFAESAV